ncbi:hypothetical protein MLD38_005489 [Melastoma candidum]|uniref:Uncharacterized protein n=1 Tax=Melastoma candidum TaxID=119954 RepID=A0ACB9RJI6_9MYRT|nr:hypothetical protein MLD38_005489 [Melastoma candidum]
MASGVAQLETRCNHPRSAASPEVIFGDGESDVMAKLNKRRREKVGDEVDSDGVFDETDDSAGESRSGSRTDGGHPVPDPSKAGGDDGGLEEGEIPDVAGEVSTNPVHDAEADLMPIESNVLASNANTGLVSDASRKDEKGVCALYKASNREKSGFFADNPVSNKIDVTDRKMFLADSAPDKYRTSGNSPYSGRYGDDWFDSGDRLRNGSPSTFQEEDSPLKVKKQAERDSSYYSGRYWVDYELDDRKASSLEKSGKRGCRDIARDVESQRGSSHSRYDSKDDRNHCRDGTRDRGVAREIEQEVKREERERSRERDRDKDRKRSYRERSIEWDSERDTRREKHKERRKDKEIDGVRRRDKEREINGNSERDKDRISESRRNGSQDRMLDKDRRSGKEDNGNRDKTINKPRRDDKKRDRDCDREKERRRNRGRERERENFEDLSRVRSRISNQLMSGDRKCDGRSDARNVDKHENYEDHGKLDTNSREIAKDSQSMDVDERSDSEEIFSFVVPNQEEDHLNKIREESRRLRQAILEKHKNQQQLQKQKDIEPEVVDIPEGRTCGGNPEQVADDGEDYVAEISFSFKKSLLRNETITSEKASGERGLGEGTPKSERSDERSDDTFHDEIFGDSPAGTRKTDEGGGLPVEKSGLSDNWDDAEGYYCYTLGEVLDGRYQVIAAHGKGVFSTVVRAKDIHAGVDEPKEVAVKILRNREAMYKAGIEELGILKKLVDADPDDKRHCVRLLSSFKLTAVRAYAKQLFISLKHLQNCGVLHCDIKPDNMLVNEAKNMVKLCDFGNAMFSGKNEITPYLVSRFYRAPEIILGLPYDHPMDIWSVGCCLYELYTGKVIFPGHTNNDMLRLHMELKGPFPKKMLRKGAFTEQHFDEDLNFIATDEDPVTKKATKRMILNVKPKDIGSIIKGTSDEDPKMLAHFKDLLDKIFMLDPDKRMTVQQALSHPFVTGK